MENHIIPIDLSASLEASATASASASFPLAIPGAISQAILTGQIIPVVASLAISLIKTGHAIKRANAYFVSDTNVQITMYNSCGEELRKEIVEVIAPIKATMAGLNILRSSNLDNDLLELGENKLKKRIKSKLEDL